MNFARELTAIAKALLKITGTKAPSGFQQLAKEVKVSDTHQQIAQILHQGKASSVILGPQAINHPKASTLRMLSNLIATTSQSRIGYLPEAGNTAGAWIAGAVPHRVTGGGSPDQAGLNTHQMLTDGLKGYVLLNVEPDIEAAYPAQARQTLLNSEFTVALSNFGSPNIKEYADVILPIAPFTETSGTFINAEGCWQSFSGVVPPLGDARPAWKVLRVLGNLFDCEGFEFVSSEDVLTEIKDKAGSIIADNKLEWQAPENIGNKNADAIVRISEMQMYTWDGLQRRAPALQSTFDADVAAIRINNKLAKKIGVSDGAKAVAAQNGARVTLPVIVDDHIADDSVLIHSGIKESVDLQADFIPVTITPAS
jgi:NADH-quinone oxidoreductase subunit G